jgi:Ca2+-transporting ATPase
LLNSRLFIIVILATSIVQVGIINFGGAFFGTVPITIDLWIRSVLTGMSILVVGMIVRTVGRRLI